MLYLIEDSELSRRAIGKYIDVYHYPDGRKELRLNGTLLPYSTYDRLSEIDQGAIVDNKRLGRTLEFISLVQSKRDNTRSQSIPAGDGPSRRRPKQEGKKSQRSLDNDDMLEALKQLQSRSEDILVKSPLMVLTGRTVVAHQLILSGQTHDVLFISFSIFMSCFSRAYLPHNE
ncbi:Putative transposase (identified by ISEscan HMM) [Klebsiella pneumoniae]|nr:Putative transposase (identified by ISEscan HMM) [Klebsiella pneumoniae]